MSYCSGQVVLWGETLKYLRSLPQGDYLLQVVNRQKGSKKSHDLYTAICDLKTMEDKLVEVDTLARHIWANSLDVTPVVYLSNVRIDQAKGYEALLREESAKLLMNKSIKARLLSTTKPAYLGMYRDFSTVDLDVPADLRDQVRDQVLAIQVHLQASGYGVRTISTSGGFHITVSAAHSGTHRLHKSLDLFGLTEFKDKAGKDVLSPLVGTYQKDKIVGVLYEQM